MVVESDGIPEKAMTDFKAWCTRRLREAGLLGARQHVWSEHGSTIYLWREAEVDHAVDYVRDGQGPDLPTA